MWERDVKGGDTFVCQDDFDRMLINGLDCLKIRERRSVFFLAWVYDSRKER
jgi:hypothetical protein